MKTLNNEVPITKCAEPKDSSVVAAYIGGANLKLFSDTGENS